jgi:hypothetical protein
MRSPAETIEENENSKVVSISFPSVQIGIAPKERETLYNNIQ